ncbi:alginate export family protein [Phenylobacterium sp.]|jgi:hypothetical protein|uniref:alginate export family protein n=1 Tax=Phenylobacterium sp. TaxID=1871053 RepID=UPI002F95F93A
MTTLRGALLAFTALAGLAGPAAAETAPSALSLLTDLRVRHETYDAGGKDAEALTARLRLGAETRKVAGFSALAEVEAIGALVDDYADGVRPRPWDAVIPDPEIVELNRAQLTWAPDPAFSAVVGRQRLVLNNARFVGNSGWRQNEQTFDAAKVSWTPAASVSLTYAYIDDVRRSTGRDHPQGAWRSDSHLLQADLAAGKDARLSAYAYQLDFRNAPAQSSNTVGVRAAGKRPLRHGLALSWEAEIARQTDAGHNPADYRADYGLLAAGLAAERWSAGLGIEQLGGDGRNAFQTPLASLHGFQGWSDVIGATPADGLRDLYLRGARTFAAPRPVKLSGELHEFRDDTGARRYGRELDAAISAPLRKGVSVEAGVARFETDSRLYPDATRTWLTLELKR